MTKAAELAIIDAAIAKLGDHSYLGPWLKEIRPELERDLTSDFAPSPMMPSKALGYAAGLVEGAKAEVKKSRDAADAYAAGVRDKAYADAADIKREAKLALERLAARL